MLIGVKIRVLLILSLLLVYFIERLHNAAEAREGHYLGMEGSIVPVLHRVLEGICMWASVQALR